MNVVAFDTLSAMQALESGGLSRPQAEAVAKQIAAGRSIDLSNLATKAELKNEVEQLRKDMQLLEQRVVQKLVGAMIAGLTILFAALRYFPPPH